MQEDSSSRKTFVVSIHDVSPVTIETTRRMLDDLAAVGVPRTSLLVIPHYHHKHPITADQAFQNNVRELAAHGHEIVLHGYYHQRPTRKSENLRDRAITRFYTAGEGEFYDLSAAEAEALLERGKADFAACRLDSVTGFIAPAWLLGAEAQQAVTAAGFNYTTLLGGVKKLAPTPSFQASQSLVYSVRSSWRVACSLAWNALLEIRLRRNQLVRLGLHPPDWQHPVVRQQALSFCSRLTQVRQVTTYAEL